MTEFSFTSDQLVPAVTQGTGELQVAASVMTLSQNSMLTSFTELKKGDT